MDNQDIIADFAEIQTELDDIREEIGKVMGDVVYRLGSLSDIIDKDIDKLQNNKAK
ncbi:hypothetical protein LCGC14_0406890 [marine sediment metagenome]|uniref:Uncharacterized protein n=1 Tax=marine sediment metagenome TaxID=412755 RepID=A0A0F9T0Q0_9ZZZZ